MKSHEIRTVKSYGIRIVKSHKMRTMKSHEMGTVKSHEIRIVTALAMPYTPCELRTSGRVDIVLCSKETEE